LKWWWIHANNKSWKYEMMIVYTAIIPNFVRMYENVPRYHPKSIKLNFLNTDIRTEIQLLLNK
jgi:hypothetical protein